MADIPASRRAFYERRKSALELERSSFITHWKELSEFILPRRGRFFVQDRNRGDKRYKSIVNSAATQATKVSRAGMLAGVMSPSRPWFSLETEDKQFMTNKDVLAWLESTTAIMNSVFNNSNLFTMSSVMFGELVLFGTAAMSHVDDDLDVARFFTHTIGSYLIGQDERYEINTFIREFDMTVQQLCGEFGEENLSIATKALYDKGAFDTWVTVTNYIGDNPDNDSSRADAKYKKITSCYWESGNPDKGQFLRESGFDEFPVYVLRWDVTAEDVWGTDCPGMVALGDVKQLQIQERRGAQAIDKMVSPPLKGPASLRNVPVSSLPGGLTIYDSDVNAGDGLTPIYKVEPRLQELNEYNNAIVRRIKECFFVDLFFAITNMEGIQPKNQLELTQRNQERLLQLGPVLERLHSEFLNKLINRTFNQLVRKGKIPDPPASLAGQPLKVSFVSTLAMAQRSEQISSINQLREYVTEFAAVMPEIVDKIDADNTVDELALILGVPTSTIRSNEAAQGVRADRAKQQQDAMQQQQQAALTQQVVGKAAPTLVK